MAWHYAPTIEHYTTNTRIYFRYSSTGTDVTVNHMYQGKFTYCLYKINNGGWYRASTCYYPLSSLGNGDSITFAVVMLDNEWEAGSTNVPSYAYQTDTYYNSLRRCDPPYLDTYVSGDCVRCVVNYNSKYYIEMYYTLNGTSHDSNYIDNMRLYLDGFKNGDRIRFYARCRKSGWENSRWISSSTITIKKPPSQFTGFNTYSGKSMDYKRINDYTMYAYCCGSEDWNNFTSKINEFRKYKGYRYYPFTNVSKDTDFKADIFNEAIYAIRPMTTNNLYTVSKGDSVYAKIFLKLKEELNNIS